MNIEHAKTIPMSEILHKIGFEPTKKRANDLWFLSPLRTEKNASFHVNIKRNIWFDFGDNIGGDTVAFVCCYLKSKDENHTVADALRWLKNMTGYIPTISPDHVPDYTQEDNLLVLKKVIPLKHPLLIKYLKSRGIPQHIGKKYLSEVKLLNKNTNNQFFALGFKNEDEGYELRNQFFKGCVKPKTITFIRGKVTKPEGVHLFEGFMDYLSVITRRKGKPFDDDAIIMNSLSCMKDASAYIKNYGYRFAYTWLDNDVAGTKARKAFAEFFRTEENLEHRPMEQVFAPYKDVNEWHVAKPELM